MTPSPHAATLTLELHAGLRMARAAAKAQHRGQMVRQIDAWLSAGDLEHFAAVNAIREAAHQRVMASVQEQEMLAIVNPRKAA